jgi:hypothetical protein
MDNRFTPNDTVVDGKGKTLRENPIMSELQSVYPSVENQRVDLRKHTIEEVSSNA